MDPHEIRKLFLSFAGEDEFRRFLEQIFRDLQEGDGLRFWQEKRWAAFRDVYPDAPADHDLIGDAFAWCPVHQQALTKLPAPNFPPRERADQYDEVERREFPFGYGLQLCVDCLAARERWIADHPWRKPPKPSIDWPKLERSVLQITEKAIESFARAHRGETFNGFAFDCNSGNAGLLLCLNTEEALRERARLCQSEYSAHYKDQQLETIAESLRWSTGDWKYQGFESAEFESQWEDVAEPVRRNCIGEEEDPKTFLSPTQTKLMESLCRVAIRLEKSDAFDSLKRDGHFRVFVTDHDDTDGSAWGRLNGVRSELGEG